MFRHFIGWFCFVAGAVFLTVNSIILWRGAARWAHDDVEWYAWGIVAALVPWVIAIMPSLITETWRPFWLVRRPSAGTLTVAVVWTVFIAYNIVNGAGAIGSQRAEKIADKEHQAETVLALKVQREKLLRELNFIPEHRPREAVERLIAAEKANRRWMTTAECAPEETTAKASREFCDGFRRLESELASATAAERLSKQLADYDRKLSQSGPVITSGVDPQTEILADVTSIEQAKIRRWLPAATPIVLELGAATLWHFGFSILGIHLRKPREASDLIAEPVFNPAPLVSPEAIRKAPVSPQQASLSLLTAQRRLAEWFFATCTRHVASGALPEDEWYAHYVEVCQRSNDEPLPLESFRRIASRYVPRMGLADGRMYYHEILPVIPEQVG